MEVDVWLEVWLEAEASSRIGFPRVDGFGPSSPAQ